MPPRTVVTRPLSPLGNFPNLASVPERPPPPTGGVARAEEVIDLGHDSSVARDADREMRASGPVPPPLPAASTVQPNFALLGAADSPMARRRNQAAPPSAPAVAETTAATPAPSMPSNPAIVQQDGPIASPAGDVPTANPETAQTRFAVRPPPGTVIDRPGQPAATQAPAGPVPSMPAAPPPPPDMASAGPTQAAPAPGAPASGAAVPGAAIPAGPAAAIRFRINSTTLGAGGLGELDSFAQKWAASGRGTISLAVRRADDLGPARERAVIEGLEKAGVPPGAIITGRLTQRPNVVELWRE